MMDNDLIQLFYADLEERSINNVFQNLKQDDDYQAKSQKERRLYKQYENLNLSRKQRKIVKKWLKAIQAKNSAYSAVIFRMGMQYCFSLLIQLADSK